MFLNTPCCGPCSLGAQLLLQDQLVQVPASRAAFHLKGVVQGSTQAPDLGRRAEVDGRAEHVQGVVCGAVQGTGAFRPRLVVSVARVAAAVGLRPSDDQVVVADYLGPRHVLRGADDVAGVTRL